MGRNFTLGGGPPPESGRQLDAQLFNSGGEYGVVGGKGDEQSIFAKQDGPTNLGASGHFGGGIRASGAGAGSSSAAPPDGVRASQ